MGNIARGALQVLITTSLLASIFAVSGILTTGSVSGYSVNPDNTISISGDADLAAFAADGHCSGSGTVNDPYIIQNLYVLVSTPSVTDRDALSISDTTANLIIRNCMFRYASGGSPFSPLCGISLNNVRNCTIEYIWSQYYDYGIKVLNSRDIIIENSQIYAADWDGIEVGSSSNIVIRNNQCNYDQWGIGVFYSNNIVAENNDCGNYDGIGILIQESSNNLVKNNICFCSSPSTGCGITLATSSDNVIERNYCHSNYYFGIFLGSSSDRNVIANNSIYDNTQQGIYIVGSSQNLIYGNLLANNNGALTTYDASHKQAFDSSTNMWNAPSYGNYWADWVAPDYDHDGIVDAPYVIDGGSNLDFYPLTTLYPEVTIESPVSGATINTNSVLITGVATPSIALDVNGVITKVNKDGSFSVVISLLDGENVITARSASPLNVSDSVVVTYSNQIPTQLDVLDQQLQETKNKLDRTETELLNALNNITANFSATNARIDAIYDLLNDTILTLNLAAQHIDALNALVNDSYAQGNDTKLQLASTIVWIASIYDFVNDTADGLNDTDANVQAIADWLQSVEENGDQNAQQIADALAWLAAVNDETNAAWDAGNATATQLAGTIAFLTQVSAQSSEIYGKVNTTTALLTLTRAWLSAVEQQLIECYAAHNLTADEVASLATQMIVAQSCLATLYDSLNETSSALGLTDEQVVELRNELNATIADLATTKATLATVQSGLSAAEKDVSAVKSDLTPMILGALGMVVGVVSLAIALVVMGRAKKP